ncbi:MAG: hypothetical protein LBE27_03570 [Deltaproteobacteria bacterium]|jgi:hypothetical protein|nr:hypothetical protein [Deltaproteobacteria bacterium]
MNINFNLSSSVFNQGAGNKLNLGDGLRIGGKKTSEIVKAEDQTSVEPTQVKSENNVTFEVKLSQNLERAQKKTEITNQLKSSIITLSSEIGRKLGTEAENEFKVGILKATEDSVNEEKIAGAVTDFFTQVRMLPDKYPTAYKHLASFNDYLNLGLDSLSDESAETCEKGLAYSLNVFFNGKSIAASSDPEIKYFSTAFAWEKREKELEAAETDDGLDGYFVMDFPSSEIIKSEDFSISQEYIQMAADYLRGKLGSEQAADYLLENYSTKFTESFATVVATVAKENGQEAAYDFVLFLNENVAPNLEASGFTFRGWNLMNDYSKSRDEWLDLPAVDQENGLWVGDNEKESELQIKRHQGVLSNFNATDSETGAKLSVPVVYDLDELYDTFLSSQKKIDLVV